MSRERWRLWLSGWRAVPDPTTGALLVPTRTVVATVIGTIVVAASMVAASLLWPARTPIPNDTADVSPGAGWSPPYADLDVRALRAGVDADAAVERWITARSASESGLAGDLAGHCTVFDDPFRPGAPLTLGGSDLAKPEPSVLVCDGSNPVALPSVAWERSVWEAGGGQPVDFRMPDPPCGLTQRTADVWSASSSPVLVCAGQRPVRVPPDGVAVVQNALWADGIARFGMSGVVKSDER